MRARDLRDLSDEELVDKLAETRTELFNLRFQSATGQLESHGRLRAVKRDIARIYTVIRERELGIRATPAPLEPAAKAKRGAAKKDDVKTEVVEDAPEASAADEVEASAAPAKAPKATAKEAK